MKQAEYYRCKNMIYYAMENGSGPNMNRVKERCFSINDAKRESRRLQKRLGDGSVRVI